MAKFLNKKEQVYDLKLTSYGNYLLSIGKFKPAYYEFYDDNILYDGRYAMYTGSNAPEKSNVNLMMHENQNEIFHRIKNETQYIEGLVLFEDVEKNISTLDTTIGDEENAAFGADETPTIIQPRIDAFKNSQAIGDAFLNAGSQNAPAWKIVAIDGQISSSSERDQAKNLDIPQINMNLKYIKKIVDGRFMIDDPTEISDLALRTTTFADRKSIELVPENPLIYAEELNTLLLTENFDIEIFQEETETAAVSATAPFEILEIGTPIYDATVTINDGSTAVTFTFKDGASAITDVEAGDVSGTDGKTTLAERLVTVINNYVADSSTTLKVSAASSNAEVTITNLNGTGQATNSENSVRSDGLTHAARITTSDSRDIDPWTGGFFTGGKDAITNLKRKYFRKEIPQVVDGKMISAQPITTIVNSADTGSVEYYFDILVDNEIPMSKACLGAQEFNKDSYYVDLDFDCSAFIKSEDAEDIRRAYYDIYGVVTEPEICQD